MSELKKTVPGSPDYDYAYKNDVIEQATADKKRFLVNKKNLQRGKVEEFVKNTYYSKGTYNAAALYTELLGSRFDLYFIETLYTYKGDLEGTDRSHTRLQNLM